MTFLDDPPDLTARPAGLDASREPKVKPAPLPSRPGLWRIVCLGAVFLALVVTGISVLQARDASNKPTPDQPLLPLETTTVTVGDLPLLGENQIITLGLSADDSQRAFSAEGTDLEIPEDRPALIGLLAEDGSLIGMRLITPTEDRAAVEINARSTARALLGLSPGVLRADLESTFRQLDGYNGDPGFEGLVDAVRINPNFSIDNELVETAFARMADRIGEINPPPDQGCDSVSANSAYVSAGSCVQPRGSDVVITNEQDRWALLYAEADDYERICAIVSPEETVLEELLVESADCSARSLLVAPGPTSVIGGPLAEFGVDQALIDERVGAATGVNVLYDYAGPFAHFAGASAGFTDDPITMIIKDSDNIADAMGVLMGRSEEFSQAMQSVREPGTAQDRMVAFTSSTRLIIDAAESSGIIPQRVGGDIGHLPILDFYSRAAERMVSGGTSQRWEADGVGRVNFGDQDQGEDE